MKYLTSLFLCAISWVVASIWAVTSLGKEQRLASDRGARYLGFSLTLDRTYSPLAWRLGILRRGPIPQSILKWKDGHFQKAQDTLLFLYAPRTWTKQDKLGWLIHIKDNISHFYSYRIREGTDSLAIGEAINPTVQNALADGGIETVPLVIPPDQVVMAIDSIPYARFSSMSHDFLVAVEGRYGQTHNFNVAESSGFFLPSTIDNSFNDFWGRTLRMQGQGLRGK